MSSTRNEATATWVDAAILSARHYYPNWVSQNPVGIGCRVVSNQRGYGNEIAATGGIGFRPDLVIEV